MAINFPFNEANIKQLECHYKWEPELDDGDTSPETTIRHLEVTIDEFPDIKMLILNVIGYLHTKAYPPQYDEAISIFDDIIKDCTDVSESQYDEYRGYELVALCNKINALVLNDKMEEAKFLFRKLPNSETLSNKTRASMYGSHGYALSLFGKKKFSKSLDMYKEAIELDPEHYCWRVGLAHVAGRIRRFNEGSQTLPTELEESTLKKAVELTNEKKAFPLALLADVIFLKCRDFEKHGCVTDPKLREEILALYEKAYELAPSSPHVLKRCGKAFHIMGKEELGVECLQEAVERDPYSSVNLYRLSQMYEFGKKLKNYELAEKYCDKAVTAGRRRNFYAELDLARIRKKRNKTYDVRKHYEDMQHHYLEDEKRVELLDAKIKAVENYNKSRRDDREDKRKGKGKGRNKRKNTAKQENSEKDEK